MDKKKIISIAQIALGALALIMVFLPWLSCDVEGVDSFNGLKVIFGDEDSGFAFSFMGLVLFILIIAIVALPVVKFLKPGNAKILNIVTIVCAVVAAILFFCVATSMMVSFDWPNGVTSEMKDGMYDSFFKVYGLGIGAILGGIIAILSCAAAAVDTFVIKD